MAIIQARKHYILLDEAPFYFIADSRTRR